MDKLDIDKLKSVLGSLNSLKNNIDKSNGILETTPIDLNKSSYLVKNYIFKKTRYDELVKNVNNFNTTDFIYLVKKSDFDKKLVKLKRKQIIMIIVTSILQLKKLIS